ncbi:MAG: cytochrome c [Sphaerobacteraceae bacterium]|nr:MAG: cytochrome c [Sphaerobacteraceae bacterium]
MWRRISVAAVGLGMLAFAAGCGGDDPETIEVDGGDPAIGEELVVSYDCASCHYIPGFPESSGHDAPGLQLWPNRAFVAGAAPNRPENVISFLMEPDSIQPGSGMPNLGISEEEARHIAAYLFTIGGPE